MISTYPYHLLRALSAVLLSVLFYTTTVTAGFYTYEDCNDALNNSENQLNICAFAHHAVGNAFSPLPVWGLFYYPKPILNADKFFAYLIYFGPAIGVYALKISDSSLTRSQPENNVRNIEGIPVFFTSMMDMKWPGEDEYTGLSGNLLNKAIQTRVSKLFQIGEMYATINCNALGLESDNWHHQAFTWSTVKAVCKYGEPVETSQSPPSDKLLQKLTKSLNAMGLNNY